MLTDFERKILRILYNFDNQRKRMPTYTELSTKTGKAKEDILTALEGLIRASNIVWDDKSSLENIKIIEGWEQPQQVQKKAAPPTIPPADLRYWTEH